MMAREDRAHYSRSHLEASVLMSTNQLWPFLAPLLNFRLAQLRRYRWGENGVWNAWRKYSSPSGGWLKGAAP
jgi:hypothetical protein